MCPATFFLFIILLIQTPHLTFCDEFNTSSVYEACAQSFSCGDIDDIGYPFWGGSQPAYCGHPSFGLTCSDESSPEITILSVKYKVLSISSQAATIVRYDLSTNICPSNPQRVSLDLNLFSYAPSGNQNITLFYGCTIVNPVSVSIPKLLNCSEEGSDSNRNNVLWSPTTGLPSIPGITSNIFRCGIDIFVTVTQEAFDSLVKASLNVTEDLLRTAVGGGFSVDWKANNSLCQDCTGSGGRCGSNGDRISTQFICYIGNSSSSSSNKRPMGIGLGIAGAVLAGVGIGWLIFRQKRRRVAAQALEHDVQVLPAETKNKGLPTPPSSNSLSSDPSPRFMRSIPSYPSSGSVNLFGRDSYYFGAQIFTYAELEEATNNFDQSRELGDGGFGTVFYGKLPDGRVVAVKRLYENNFKRVEQFMNEVEILTKLRHENLVVLYGCTSKQSRDLLLVYEYIPNGTVADHLHGKRAKSGLLSWPIRMKIAIETADALAFLHKSEIIHRDVKTNNILLDNDFHVKVADFGLSRLFPTDVTHVSTAPQGTPGYVDPEYYQVYQLTERSDVYSFGVVLIELISSLQAVDTNRHRHDINLSNMAINKIQNHALHELVDPSLGFVTNSSARRMITLVAELAFRCLQQVRDMRPSMQEVLDTLRRIENEELNGEKVEVLDIVVDDVALLKGNATSSPDSSVTDDKGASSSRPNSIG
ncbi:PREDICTED: LEAF RUST 10 DISEASE-RESISTANCE LOCUS RECEPTOR-LIKE PROTEIN KINASE-like 1.3 isoform X4 [Ipomoea nil]|uniref:LEAF RUST 10 DISEASE-RESISTANCE LOCUS RECEPTOR-LIKE PROTEIN KINASE-like 1.3 isoform X4 n=1 Tax=Ipomoea nil TaxID=35883 RepID=UPI0009014A71|nr:PREDICTED: LEAF RUST 10 DISEASE-RESISTANCE LOCUS RECEPTOR-LIKE PROTEIN KINASE-like 1.3 isoform X4 [Ipomoea nil]